MISAAETAGSEHLGRDLRAGQPQQRSRDTSARERDDDLRIAQERLRSPIAPRAIRALSATVIATVCLSIAAF